MMKFNYTYILISFLVIAVFSMCKKDLGNYNYNEIPLLSIDTVGNPGPFVIKQNIQEIEINPKVNYTGNKTLEYYWIYGDGSNDTLSREKNIRTTLNWRISPMPYTLTFKVVERETGNMSAVQYKVTITGSTGLGLLIGHERDGTADVDLINTPTGTSSSVLRNIHATVNGYRLPGKVTGLGTIGENNMVMFSTDQAASMMDFDGMTQRYANRDIFGLLNPTVFRPEMYAFIASNGSALINDGKLYQNFIANFAPGQMTQRVVTADGSDYRLHPQYIQLTIGGGTYFDELGKRFLIVGSAGSNTFNAGIPANATARFSLTNIDRKFLFAQKGFQLYTDALAFLFRTTLYAFFADNNGGTGRYLYVAGMETPATPDFALIDIAAASDIQNAAYYAVLETSPCVYYATKDKLHMLRINASGNSYIQAGIQFTPPIGEEISCIKIARTGPVSPDYFYVSTYNPVTKQGTVHQLSINTGTGALQSSPLNSWTGFDGKVTLMDWKRY